MPGERAGLRGESQPIEPDPGHAGGGRDASAAQRTHTRLSNLPAIAADILERLRAAPAARALHHQCGGAELHRQHAAGGRRGAVDDHRAEGGRAFAARADALLVNLGTFDRSGSKASLAAIGVANKAGMPWVLDPVFIDRSPPRAAFARKLVALKPRALRLNRAEFAALAGGRTDDAALARFAKARRTVVGLTGETDLVADGERLASIANGHPLMARVTAMGCAASALVGAHARGRARRLDGDRRRR